jgi:hypothetical protein
VKQKRVSSGWSKRRSKFRRPPKTATHRPKLDDRATTSKRQPPAQVLAPAPVQNPWRWGGRTAPASSTACLPAITRYAPSPAQLMDIWWQKKKDGQGKIDLAAAAAFVAGFVRSGQRRWRQGEAALLAGGEETLLVVGGQGRHFWEGERGGTSGRESGRCPLDGASA